MTIAPISHIQLDDRGVAWVADSNIKVIEIALDRRAHGFSAEEIAFQHYQRLSLAQIYAALSYYHDHQAEFDAEMDRQLAAAEQARAATLDSPGRQRLRGQGKLP